MVTSVPKTLPIKIHSRTDLTPYGSTDDFVTKIHRHSYKGPLFPYTHLTLSGGSHTYRWQFN